MSREGSAGRRGWSTSYLGSGEHGWVHVYPTVEADRHKLTGADCSCGPTISDRVVTHQMRAWIDVTIPNYPPEEAQP